MIHQLSGKIAFMFSEKKIIKNDMREVYAYGFELLLATLITGSIIFGLSTILGIFCKTIFLLVPFILTRSKAGGYHAKTHLGCILSFTLNYLFVVSLLSLLPVGAYAFFSTASLIASFITVLSIGCIPNENRPVTPVEKQEFDKKCKHLSFVITAAGFAIAYLMPVYGIYFSAGTLMSAGSMIVEKIKLTKETKNECS